MGLGLGLGLGLALRLGLGLGLGLGLASTYEPLGGGEPLAQAEVEQHRHRAVLGTLRVDEQVGRVRVALEVAVCEELHGPRLAAARDEELAVDLVKG